MSKIVFVDGPNGIGKDYFIGNLAKLLAENNKTYIIKSVKDYMPRDNPIISIRQFSKEFFKESYFNLDVAKAHKECVQDVINIANNGEYDYIIINRSILSYIIYNIFIPKTILNGHGEFQDLVNKIPKEQFRDAENELIYTNFALRDTSHTSYLFVLQPDFNMTYNSIIARMESSRNVKYTDYEHMVLMTIFNAYVSYVDSHLKHLYYFDHAEALTSSYSSYAYQKLVI
jgi:hypothetical protein